MDKRLNHIETEILSLRIETSSLRSEVSSLFRWTVGYLRYYWIGNGERKTKNYNYKVSIFRNSIIERLIWKTPLYGLKVVTVSPKGTTHSEERKYTMKRYRLDRHMASAYLIALKAGRTLKSLQRH